MPSEPFAYLELSEEGGSSHKFYEVVVDGCSVTVRFGRIGDAGQRKAATFSTPEQALADASKKVAEKLRKGYERATAGVRKKRSVTRREIVSKPSSSKGAPLLYRFDTGERAFGLFVDGEGVWVGNESGAVYRLDHDGSSRGVTRLREGVKCIVRDGAWLYAGADDGHVYDLTGKVPRSSYVISEDIDIYWLDIRDGVMGVSDALGQVSVVNHEDESQWRQKSPGRWGWMVRCDELGVYHGHETGVTMYDWEDGRRIWHAPTDGHVLFGWQEEAELYVALATCKVVHIGKRGQLGSTFPCDDKVFSCATSGDGRLVFAGDASSSIYCFDAAGKRLWKLATGCGSAFSMQHHQGRLYVTTTEGALACLDVSEASVRDAERGLVPATRSIKAPAAAAAPDPLSLEQAAAGAPGVELACVDEGGSLHVHVVAQGYDRSLRVQFPRELRRAGARYLVSEIRPSNDGKFYRVLGDIKSLTRQGP